MNQMHFKYIYIGLLSLEFITLYTLTILNINSVLKNRKTVPELFRETIPFEKYQKSIAYTVKKEHFSILRLIISTILTATLLLSGFFGFVETQLSALIGQPILLGLTYVGLVSLIIFILDLPFSIYSTFVIEEDYGFNKMTIKSFISDSLKQGVLAVILGGILLTALFIFMDKTGDLWWVWASGFFIAFQLIIFILYPNLIAPIFNKFTSIEDGELKTRLEELSKKANFKISGIFVMDGSKRSGHSNAYFTGIGSSKRIVLYDTLIESLSVDELCGVLAHEIGHWKKGHIKKRLLLTFLTVPAGFFILSLALSFAPMFQAFNMEVGTYHGLIVLIMMISGPFTFFLGPISNHMSRKHEFEADNFAKELTGEANYLISALLGLSKENLSNLTPDKSYSAFHYSHPPVTERVKNLQKNV